MISSPSQKSSLLAVFGEGFGAGFSRSIHGVIQHAHSPAGCTISYAPAEALDWVQAALMWLVWCSLETYVHHMPDIYGFHALTYDPSIDLTAVIAPPYDVVDATQRTRLVNRHPYNFVQIDLPEAPGNPRAEPVGSRYRAAAETLSQWRALEVLRRDPAPVLYRYDQEFVDPERNHRVTRRGVLAAVALSPWSERVVRPHEATLAAPREDRARLLAATRVHLSPVFAGYDDPAGGHEPLLATCGLAPDRVATSDDGTVHKVWRITDPEAIAGWAALLKDKPLYVLDGHHRYETMVGFHSSKFDGVRPSVPARGLMFLVAMSEPGLIVLPTHRVVHGAGDLDRGRFLTEVAFDCEIERRAGAGRDPAPIRAALDAATRPTFAAVFPHDPDLYLLSVRAGSLGDGLVPDTTLMHELVLDRALAAIAPRASARLQYISNTAMALDQIGRGEGDLALLMRAPTLAEIKRIADAGRVMSQKSTYFFPKLASGLVAMQVE